MAPINLGFAYIIELTDLLGSPANLKALKSLNWSQSCGINFSALLCYSASAVVADTSEMNYAYKQGYT